MKREDCIYSEVCDNECKSFCLRYSEMNFMLDTSGIPKSKQKFNRLIPNDCDMQAFMALANIQSNIVEFVSKGCNLYLHSDNCGNGKTTWAIKLLMQYFHEMWAGNGFLTRGLFINVPVLITAYKNNMSRADESLAETLNKLSSVDIVVWDDVAVSQLTDFETNLLLSYIDQRVLNDKCNIFTGNINPSQLKNKVGERLSSRICSGNILELKGGDNRYGTASNS